MNINETSLMHHGVKGQKWGVRRYQNRDGTLTSAGKKRYVGKTDPAGHKSGSAKKTPQKKETTEEEQAAKAANEEARKRRNVRVGMAVGAAAVAAIGGVAVYKLRKGKTGLTDRLPGADDKIINELRDEVKPKKRLKDMTTAQLQAANTRMAAEQKYKQLKKKQAEEEGGKFDGVKQGLAAAAAATAMVKEAAAAAKKWKESKAESESGSAEKNGDADISAMSDAQLRERVNRFNLENQYRNMMRQSVPQETNKGTKSRVDSILDGIGSALTTASKIADKADVIAEAFDRSADEE